jgi:mannitol-1-phosphate/altronate dehydrogenase
MQRLTSLDGLPIGKDLADNADFREAIASSLEHLYTKGARGAVTTFSP